MSDMTIVGTGRVGLITGLGFAEKGFKVTATDKDVQKISCLNEAILPFYEPGVEELLRLHLKSGRICFTEDVAAAIRASQVIFVCVGTPEGTDGSADMTQVEEVARLIASEADSYKVVVEKSTVPLRTAQWIQRTISLHGKGGVSVDVASNPEFLREGSGLHDFLNPDRIVIGVESEAAKPVLTGLYRSFDCPILVTDLNTAEIIKHACNSFLAMKISFINMVADLCEAAGGDVKSVAGAMALDKRIAPLFLEAGVGYGGSCLPKDLRAFIQAAQEFNLDFGLLREVERINFGRIDVFIKKVQQALWVVKDKTLAVLGLAFKPETDDIREAPSIKVIERLLKEGGRLRLYDPKAMPNMQVLFPQEPGRIEYTSSAYQAAEGAHALLILTDWEGFRHLDLGCIREKVATPIIVDGRNLWERQEVEAHGFEYYCMGRG